MSRRMTAANLRRVHGWFREVWFGADDMAQALRARVMPLFAEDPLRTISSARDQTLPGMRLLAAFFAED